MRQPPRTLLTLAVALLTFSLLTACGPETSIELTTTELVNGARRDAGRAQLRPDARLVDVARVRSADMAAHGYFSHTPPGGCNYACLMQRSGVPYSHTGETIAWTTSDWAHAAESAVLSWTNSGPHTEQLLGCQYERMGAGAALALNGRVYITVVFEGNASC